MYSFYLFPFRAKLDLRQPRPFEGQRTLVGEILEQAVFR
jgi:hypothetical protein